MTAPVDGFYFELAYLRRRTASSSGVAVVVLASANHSDFNIILPRATELVRYCDFVASCRALAPPFLRTSSRTNNERTRFRVPKPRTRKTIGSLFFFFFFFFFQSFFIPFVSPTAKQIKRHRGFLVQYVPGCTRSRGTLPRLFSTKRIERIEQTLT